MSFALFAHLPTFIILDFFPVYFQACKGVSPILSGIYTLCLCAFAPGAILTGMSVKATGRYRPQIWIAWVIVLIAMGLLSAPAINGVGTKIGTSLGYLVLLGLGNRCVLLAPVRSRLFILASHFLLSESCALTNFLYLRLGHCLQRPYTRSKHRCRSPKTRPRSRGCGSSVRLPV